MADTILNSCAHCGHTNSQRGLFCSVACRFWSKVNKSTEENGCWTWTGCKDGNGYGMFTLGGRPQRAHRVAFEQWYGNIPPGQLACHRCDNPSCCNPEHLFLGSAGDNNRDRARKGRTSYAAAIEVMRQKKIGKRPPESTLEAARLANTGKKRPPEVVEKIRAAHLGVKRSEETKAKLRAAWVRRKEMVAGRM